MTPGLIARVVNQAMDTEELILTVGEWYTFDEFLADHPHAAIISAGRPIVLAELPIHILPEL